MTLTSIAWVLGRALRSNLLAARARDPVLRAARTCAALLPDTEGAHRRSDPQSIADRDGGFDKIFGGFRVGVPGYSVVYQEITRNIF